MKLNKTWIISISSLVVLAVAVIVFLVIYTKPTAIPEHEKLVEDINQAFPGGAAREIMDVIYIDKEHAFIPFLSIRGDYSFSLWEWKFDQWELMNINTNGFPILWKLEKDPSSYYIVWNLHPDDGVEELHMYLNRQRNFFSSSASGKHYYPSVQVKHPISVKDRTYGVMKLPDNWVHILKAIEPTQNVQNSLFTFNHVSTQLNIKAIPYDGEKGKVFPERSVNGSQYTSGNFNFQHIFIMNEAELDVLPEQ